MEEKKGFELSSTSALLWLLAFFVLLSANCDIDADKLKRLSEVLKDED